MAQRRKIHWVVDKSISTDGDIEMQPLHVDLPPPPPVVPPAPRAAAATADAHAPDPLKFFRTLHLVAILFVTVFLGVAFLGHAFVFAGIDFIPGGTVPQRWGTIFLLPLAIQWIFALVSQRALTTPTWMATVAGYTMICIALVGWSIANIIVSLVLYAATLSGLTLGLYTMGAPHTPACGPLTPRRSPL